METVKLRPITLSDSSAIFNIIDNNRTSLRRWLTFVDFTVSEDYTMEYIKSAQPYNSDGDIVFVIESNDEIVGLIGFQSINMYRCKAELGYWISPEHENRGIMSRAVADLLKVGFMEYKFNRIEIKCAVENKKSSAIALKFGFTLEGIERDGELLSDGKYADMAVYSLLLREYLGK